MTVISPDSRTTRIANNYPFIREFCNRLHGSGINWEWTVDETPTNFRLNNKFDCMNQNGSEVQSVPFTVIIPKCDVDSFRVQANTNRRYWWNLLGLKEYLTDTAASVINELTSEETGCKQAFRIVEGK